MHVLLWICLFAWSVSGVSGKNMTQQRRMAIIIPSAMIAILLGSFVAWNIVYMMPGYHWATSSRLLSLMILLTQCWLLRSVQENMCTDGKRVENFGAADATSTTEGGSLLIGEILV
jgi:hypothetical protein